MHAIGVRLCTTVGCEQSHGSIRNREAVKASNDFSERLRGVVGQSHNFRPKQ